ncbi:MAG: CoA transferase, partial [Rhodospirillales bacterium]
MTPAFEELMQVRGLGLPEEGEVTISGSDPVIPARFRLGEAAAGVLAGVGVAVTDILELKTGARQKVAIDVRQAAAAMRSGTYLEKPAADGGWARSPMTPSREHARSMTAPWQCRDGRWFLSHFNLPHLQKRVLGVLGCEADPGAVAKAMAKWDAQDLDDAIAGARACGSIVRSNAEWMAHPHGAGLAQKPVIEIEKIGESDPIPFASGGRPLDGIRVLDLTRILAGPIAARTLAENGADVLMVTAEHLPQVQEHVIDTSHGKRSCFLD